MSFKKHIPNIITLLNLFCGCIAITFVVQQRFEMAFYFVCLGIFLDFFDGFFARLFQVASPLGLQLDSLADMVTSGVVPGLTMFYMMLEAFGLQISDPFSGQYALAFLGFLVTLGSCYRLANFNIDTRQTDSFIGLPTPANALFILSLPLVVRHFDSFMVFELLSNYGVLLAISIGSAYILNAEIPLFSLKVKKLTIKDNKLTFFFLIVSLLLLVTLQFLGIPLVILFYVFLSMINNKWIKQ
ncbi:CDP-alcohol phosphatidyltransferase family protein [Flavobacterium sp.]|jgi:CDP-diacylglycerol--serine O-phosphatidyltransferase|uniref:CDP-alcohol phosphatidyltransferase family protein n=1 Tax=Flavobacterium sp. TaxID=239 RepID=UPI0022C8A836|nr:CDP-alcohol phosphatidyltransferase family protein [Flavobacterium sp.]MCZ8229318.1 CDP-alcohol phosphatidyltransferase family protein [Flavobacterium sp.]